MHVGVCRAMQVCTDTNMFEKAWYTHNVINTVVFIVTSLFLRLEVSKQKILKVCAAYVLGSVRGCAGLQFMITCAKSVVECLYQNIKRALLPMNQNRHEPLFNGNWI